MQLQNLLTTLALLGLLDLIKAKSFYEIYSTTTTTTTTTKPIISATVNSLPINSRAYMTSAVAVPPAYGAEIARNLMLASVAPAQMIQAKPMLVPHRPSPQPALLTPAAPPQIGQKSTTKYFNKSLTKKRRIDDVSSIPLMTATSPWKCPNITSSRSLECGCDLPHTLRCTGDLHGLELLADNLRTSPYSISLLDCSLRNVTFLSDARIFEGISLHGLVISSGEIKRVHKSAFLGIRGNLQALGLPGNQLLSVPWNAIFTLTGLERLDLSNNKIKALGTSDFAGLNNLIYLELSHNQISSISQRAFTNLRKLEVLKLNGNRLGDFPSSLNSLNQCFNLRELDLSSNNLNGPLSANTIPGIRSLETLNLNRNMIKSIQNKALQNFSRLLSLSLRHNQIDVLQDHAFYGLGALDSLDLSYNGIVAISSASLQHLTRLTTLDLTHNFLRALTSDLITPLPSLSDLRLAGNDISIVAKNALDGARELKHLLMQDNPLSCDCSIRSFAEWLQISKIQRQDLLSATCVTPPRLEGAPLMQVPVETLNCEMDNVEHDNANILQQLEAITKPNQTSMHIKDLSEMIILHELHYSADYGLILTWILNLSKNDYMCDSIFVYKESNINEILIDNSPIHCESKIIDGQNTVSVIVPDSSTLSIGESYRFCLVLDREHNPIDEPIVGCSNITKLQLSQPGAIPEVRQYQRRPYYTAELTYKQNQLKPEHALEHELQPINQRNLNAILGTQQPPQQHQSTIEQATLAGQHFDIFDSLSRSFLPGLGLGILVTTIVVLIWGATRLRQNVNHHHHQQQHNSNSSSRPTTPTATTCYAASEHIARLTDAENGTRYLKLQATTSL